MQLNFDTSSFIVFIIAVILVGSIAAFIPQVREWLKQRARSRECPPAEPFAPSVRLPVVVDAAVVFTSHEEAQRQVEAGVAPITRVQSEVQGPRFSSFPSHFGSSNATNEGNTASRVWPEVMRGLPVDHTFHLPEVNASSCSLSHLSGTRYQLRRASIIYGKASYLSHSSSVKSVGDPSEAMQHPEPAGPVHVPEGPS
ncbi:hypothetical protein TraAM80_09405 [Trypanosoma rangeli]|uniref:Uncharacterized protein n=1 Tax=Trypanosoma rangeli TaxID=5698 RepID=A0A3R7LHE7_TRYRA|nr:uncharacterized protein TraAM80_09405 [Trypanosoma rangeli]RNE97326.1 hypothetical protein TraAM80_09405 [Trypanosoma rangeli]|eukprot:RNE97326.1 hypothetical protein TraAM80_09405 [Trypanosoma rangeli]